MAACSTPSENLAELKCAAPENLAEVKSANIGEFGSSKICSSLLFRTFSLPCL